MPEIMFDKTMTLIPGMSGELQSASYAFIPLDLDLPAAGGGFSAFLAISFESAGAVQLPIALYGPEGRVRLTRASEPSRGAATLRYPVGGETPACGPDRGRWKLVLHKRILGELLPIRIRVETEPAGQAVSPPTCADEGFRDEGFAFPGGIPESGPGWYCGELHLHSDMSTGRTDVATIRRVALDRGLDFLALTDHFTPSHWDRIEELGAAGTRPLFLRSVEIAGDRGHANLHGVASWPDPFPDDGDGALEEFLGRPIAGSMEKAADFAHAQGGLFCVNHPLSAGVSWRYGEFPLRKADLLEIACLPDGPVSFLYPTLWDRLLCDGLKPTGVGSSDSHDPLQDGPWALGRIRNWVYASSLSREGILQGLAAGRSYVAVGGSRLSFTGHGKGDETSRVPMGSEVELDRGETCEFEIALSSHPSGNLFIMKDGFLAEVRYLPAAAGVSRLRYAVESGGIAAKGSFLRLEFHEDLEKAAYHGMAFRDHRSLRLLSNPIHMRVRP